MIVRHLALPLLLSTLSFAQSSTPAAAPPPAAAKPEAKPPATPPPSDKSIPQTITVNGKTLHYTATVGTITLKANTPEQKPTGEVTYIAYTLDGPKDPTHQRPVTFALNGGPGA